MIYWFFGPPGVGKDYVAQLYSQLSGVKYINGDSLLTKAEKQKLTTGQFTQTDRIKKLARIIKYLKSFKEDLIMTDSLPDGKSRKFLATNLKNKVMFILVTTTRQKHLSQIHNRKNHFLKAETLKNYIKKNWEPIIDFPHLKIKNLSKLETTKELQKIIKKVAKNN